MPVAAHRWFPPTSPLLDQRWDADAFVFGLDERGSWKAMESLRARFREGLRAGSSDAVRHGLYRPSSIRELSLHDDDLAPMPSSWGEQSPVGLGDVVLSKFLPIVAAWVSPVTPRRPIDANCVRVIGLEKETGFWVANVVMHPNYQAVLARRSAGAALPRLGLRDLRALRFPDPPPGIDALVVEWTRASQELATARGDVRALQIKADAWAGSDAPKVPGPLVPRFYPPTDIEDAWLPARVALRGFQAEVERRGWPALSEFLSTDTERLRGRRLAALRVLRLSNADGVFGFNMPDLAELQHPSFRIYGHPLVPQEVLLSVLGSAPKVVFHHPARSATIWLADHWVRFHQMPDPGALAVLLQTRAVAWQLAMAATGAMQQFVARTELGSVRVPWPDPATTRRWHAELCSALERIDSAKAKLAAIRAATAAEVDRCLGRSE